MNGSSSLVVLGVIAALTLGACGSDGSGNSADPEAEPQPQGASPTPEAATSTPAAGASPTALSGFEDAPQVKVARKFAAAAARDVNAGSAALPGAVRFLSERGRDRVVPLFGEEIGYYFPGPLPFTPLSIKADGAIVSCMWLNGWSRKHKGGKPARKKQISPVRIEMTKKAGKWLVSDYIRSDANCTDVTVQGVKW